jgi:hypothetical protein
MQHWRPRAGRALASVRKFVEAGTVPVQYRTVVSPCASSFIDDRTVTVFGRRAVVRVRWCVGMVVRFVCVIRVPVMCPRVRPCGVWRVSRV